MRWSALGVGLAFGFLLTASGLGDYDTIHDGLLLTDPYIFLMMGSAMAVAFAGLAVLRRTRPHPVRGPAVAAAPPHRAPARLRRRDLRAGLRRRRDLPRDDRRHDGHRGTARPRRPRRAARRAVAARLGRAAAAAAAQHRADAAGRRPGARRPFLGKGRLGARLLRTPTCRLRASRSRPIREVPVHARQQENPDGASARGPRGDRMGTSVKRTTRTALAAPVLGLAALFASAAPALAADGATVADLKPVPGQPVDGAGGQGIGGDLKHCRHARRPGPAGRRPARRTHPLRCRRPPRVPTAADNNAAALAGETNPDKHLTTTEGGPAYGEIVVSLTKSGDTSPEVSGLAVDRFGVGDDIKYSRGDVQVSEEVAQAILSGQAVVVVHGVDYDGDGAYSAGDRGMSDLDPSLPGEATDPAICGVLNASQMGDMPSGGVSTGGGSTTGTEHAGLIGLGALAVAGGGAGLSSPVAARPPRADDRGRRGRGHGSRRRRPGRRLLLVVAVLLLLGGGTAVAVGCSARSADPPLSVGRPAAVAAGPPQARRPPPPRRRRRRPRRRAPPGCRSR